MANEPIEGEHPYTLYLDGIALKRTWAGEVRNVSLLVAISMKGTQTVIARHHPPRPRAEELRLACAL